MFRCGWFTSSVMRLPAMIVGRRLLAESRTASMICVGSVGFGSPTRTVLAPTVAIIRSDDASRSLTGCDAVVIDGSPGNDAAQKRAMQQARRRNASVLAVSVRHRGSNGVNSEQPVNGLRTWIGRYPDVAVQLVAARGGVTRFLAETNQTVQLAVIGRADGDPIQRIVGPVGD